MGGELTLTSEPGHGSTFSVRLYLRTIDAPAPQAQAAPAWANFHGFSGHKRLLMVVDDQPVQRQMLAGMLLPMGFDVVEAAGGKECVEALANAASGAVPEAILLDLSMDDIDGWQTARLIRQRGFADIAIIVVSANVFENQPGRLAANGCQAFVAKPVLESELFQALQQHLGLSVQAGPLPGPHAAHTAHFSPLTPLPGASESGLHARPTMPQELRADLINLARIGHVHGLERLLARLTAEHPALAQPLAELQVLVGQCDLDGVLAALVKAAPSNPLESAASAEESGY